MDKEIHPNLLAQILRLSHDGESSPSPAPQSCFPLLSLIHAQTHSSSTEIPLSGICGHSLCALMGKKRHPISPLAGPAGCGLMKKLLSEAIRALMVSGQPWLPTGPQMGLWSVSKQCEHGLHPGALSYSLTASPGMAQAPQLSRQHHRTLPVTTLEQINC